LSLRFSFTPVLDDDASAVAEASPSSNENIPLWFIPLLLRCDIIFTFPVGAAQDSPLIYKASNLLGALRILLGSMWSRWR
jgi:hypothetical protein